MELKAKSNNFVNGIIFAISYFSSLPIRLKEFDADEDFYRGVIYGLPIAGAVLAIVSIFTFLFLNLFFPSFYSAFLSSFIYLLYYGFLHLEGLADTIDGWYASLSGKDVYEVMKEPHIGAIGAIGTFCIITIKVGVLTYLFYLEEFLFIFLSFVLSRFILYFILDLDIHEKSSFLNSMKKVKKNLYIFDTFLLPLKCLSFWIIKTISKRIGFINGDITGFTIEMVELFLLHICLFVVV